MNDIIAIIKGILTKISLEKLLGAGILFVMLIVLSRIVAGIAGKLMLRTKITEGLNRFITQIIKFVLYFISVLIVCDSLGIPITSLLALFSLLGLAISLSVQSLLSNLMSGFSVLMLKPFNIGDYIETDISGTVKNVGLFYTEIVTADNKKVYIPNEKIMANKLTNYNSEEIRRIDVLFNAGYEYDTEAVKAALKDAVDSVPTLLKTPEPTIGISQYGESAVIYSVWVWTASDDYFKSKFALMDAVSQSYKKHGISMAYNRLEVEMVNNKNKEE